MKKIFICILFLFQAVLIIGSSEKENGNSAILFPPNIGPDLNPETKPEIPLIPLIPALPNKVETIDEDKNIRHLEKNFTVMMEAKTDIYVPIEIVSDISLKALVFGDETVQVPFEIELNREPEKKNFYRIQYSEDKIDIDNDGKIDTYINSPEFANSRIITDNFVEIQGKNISNEGKHRKKVYITIEAGI